MANVLVIDDEVCINHLVGRVLTPKGHSVQSAYNLAEGVESAISSNFDLILLDLVLPDGNGLDSLPLFMDQQDPPEIIIITGVQDINGAKYAIETGVFDYLQKPLGINDIRLICDRALEFKALRSQRREVRLFKRDKIIGKNKKLEKCLEDTSRAAAVDTNVLITGETGTGKEAIARAIHENSPRSANNFVIVDCAALTNSLMSSTLFGHEKGAYTGAENRREGRVLMADKGTLFLDEIGELDMDAQKLFLGFLNDKCFYPLGAKHQVTSDFRLVSATNRNLEKEVAENRFRGDLYHRIAGKIIHLPPLRERKEDIRELVFYFVDRICHRMGLQTKKVYPEFIETLMCYDWPGNVRELMNNLDTAIVNFPEDPVLQPRSLPAKLRVAVFNEHIASAPSTVTAAPNVNADLFDKEELPYWKDLRKQVIESLEKQYFQELFSRTGGRAKDMARLSDLSLPRIYALFKKYRP